MIDPCSNERLTWLGRLEAIVALDIRIWAAGYAEIRQRSLFHTEIFSEDLFPDSDWLHLEQPFQDGEAEV